MQIVKNTTILFDPVLLKEANVLWDGFSVLSFT